MENVVRYTFNEAYDKQEVDEDWWIGIITPT